MAFHSEITEIQQLQRQTLKRELTSHLQVTRDGFVVTGWVCIKQCAAVAPPIHLLHFINDQVHFSVHYFQIVSLTDFCL